MSQKAVTQIIGRALSDRSFRRLLETSPNTALAGFDLAQDEVNLIRSSLQAGAGPAASELESRVSRARLPLDVLSGMMEALSAQADSIPTSGPTFGTVSFGGKEGVGGLGSGPTGGGTGASQVFPGADTGGGPGDLEHGVVGTGPHEWGSASSETGDSEIPEPDDALNLGPDVGPDLIEGEAGSAPAGGAEIGEVEMPQGVHPGVVDIQGEEGDETGVANTMGEDDESGAIDIQGEGGGGSDAAETGGEDMGPGGETGATETGPGMDDGGASEVERGMGPAQPSSGDMGSGDTGAGGESGVVDIQGEGGGETGAAETGGDIGPGGETGATETGPGMDDGGASEVEGGMGPAQPSAGDMGSGGAGAGGESGASVEVVNEGGDAGAGDVESTGGGEAGSAETGAVDAGAGGESGASSEIVNEGGAGPGSAESQEGGVLDMSGLGSFYGGGSTDSGSQGSDGSDHDDGSSGAGGDSGGGDDSGGDDDGGDDDGGDDDGGDEGGGEDGYSVDGGADAGSRPGHGAMPIGAGSAGVTGGLSGGGEGDDSGQPRVILGGGTGGGGSEGDDTGRGGPGIAGAIPSRQASPELAPLYDPVENQASVASDAAVKADANPEAGNLAAAAGDLSVSKDQGGELADQAESEAKG